MAGVVAELKAVLGLDTGQFRRAKDAALSETQTFASRLQGSFKRIGMAIGAGLGVNALIQFGRRTLQLADDIDTQAQAIGLTTDQLQGFQFAARRASESTQAMLEMVGRIQNVMGEAANGNKRFQETLDRIGIDINGGFVPAMEALGRYVVRTNGDAAAMADIFDVLGTRSGLRLINTLKLIGNEGFQTIIDKGKEAGQVMDETLTKELAAANIQLQMLGNRATIVFAQFLGGLKEIPFLLKEAFAAPDIENEAPPLGEALRNRRAHAERKAAEAAAKQAAAEKAEADKGLAEKAEAVKAEDELNKALDRAAKARERLMTADELLAAKERDLADAHEELRKAHENSLGEAAITRAQARVVNAQVDRDDAARRRDDEQGRKEEADRAASERRGELGMAALKMEAELARLGAGGLPRDIYRSSGMEADAAARMGGAVSAGSGADAIAQRQFAMQREQARLLEQINETLEEIRGLNQ